MMETSKQEIRAELKGKYNIDIDDLMPLLDWALWYHKRLPQIRKDTQKRIKFLTETLKKWQKETEKVFLETDSKELHQRGGTWRFIRLIADPHLVVQKIFRTDQIQELIYQHEEFLKLLSFVHEVSPWNLLIFNLADIFRHNESTSRTPLHLKHGNWTDILQLLEYWRQEIESLSRVKPTEVIPYVTLDALRKRYEKTRQKIEEEYGPDDSRFRLDPRTLNYIKDRESLDRALDEGWYRLSQNSSSNPQE